MEVDYAENEGSSSEDEDTESSSVSEDGDSSGARAGGAGSGVPAPGARQAALRTPGSCVLRGAGRGIAEGAETGSGRVAAPGPVPGGSLARVGCCGPGLVGSGRGGARLRVGPPTQAGTPSSWSGRPGNVRSPPPSLFSPLQPILGVGGLWGRVDLCVSLAVVERMKLRFQVSLSPALYHLCLLLGCLGSCPVYSYLPEVFHSEREGPNHLT